MWGARLDTSSRVHMRVWSYLCKKGPGQGKEGGTSSTSVVVLTLPRTPFMPHLHALWSEVSKKGIRKRKQDVHMQAACTRAAQACHSCPPFFLTHLTHKCLPESPAPFLCTVMWKTCSTVHKHPICRMMQINAAASLFSGPCVFTMILWPNSLLGPCHA